jgi:hypothetical protein
MTRGNFMQRFSSSVFRFETFSREVRAWLCNLTSGQAEKWPRSKSKNSRGFVISFKTKSDLFQTQESLRLVNSHALN